MTSLDKKRCDWVTQDPVYINYHDFEWGVFAKEDRYLFEHLVLESAQAGLSWITILKKRENYRRLFSDFDPRLVAKYTTKHVADLMCDSGIVRNKSKIEAAINNAQQFLKIQKEFGSFHNYSMQFIAHKRIINHYKSVAEIPKTIDSAKALAKDLKNRGFKFLGPTTIYAHMQATGMINDHVVGCFRHGEVM